MCVYVCAHECRCSQKPEEGIGPPDDCGLFCHSLEEQQALGATDLSLQFPEHLTFVFEERYYGSRPNVAITLLITLL